LTKKTIFYYKQGGKKKEAGNKNVEEEERKRKKGKTGNKKIKEAPMVQRDEKRLTLVQHTQKFFFIAIYHIFSLKGRTFKWVLGVAVLSSHRSDFFICKVGLRWDTMMGSGSKIKNVNPVSAKRRFPEGWKN